MGFFNKKSSFVKKPIFSSYYKWLEVNKITSALKTTNGHEWLHDYEMNSDASKLIVGAPFGPSNLNAEDYRGLAKVYSKIDGQFVETASFNGTYANGNQVAINSTGDIIAIANYADPVAGGVKIYSWNGSSWIQLGSSLAGQDTWSGVFGEAFGSSIAMNDAGNVIVIGAPDFTNFSGINGVNYGRAFIYSWNGSDWQQTGLINSPSEYHSQTGYNVAINSAGNIIAISSIGFNGSSQNQGRVDLYEWNGVNWIKKGQSLLGNFYDSFGWGLSLNAAGDRVAIAPHGFYTISGSPDLDNQTSGYVKVYSWNSSTSTWNQLGNTMYDFIPTVRDKFGWNVSLNSTGDKVVTSSKWAKMHLFNYDSNSNSWLRQPSIISGGGYHFNKNGNFLCQAKGTAVYSVYRDLYAGL